MYRGTAIKREAEGASATNAGRETPSEHPEGLHDPAVGEPNQWCVAPEGVRYMLGE